MQSFSRSALRCDQSGIPCAVRDGWKQVVRLREVACFPISRWAGKRVLWDAVQARS